MYLLDLPREILILILDYLESLQDLHALTLTCRAFSNIPSLINNELLVRLAFSPHTGLQPYPHLLLAVKARRVADWAVQDDSHREELFRVIKGGTEKVLHLGLRISPLTLDDLRHIHSARLNVLILLSVELDPRYGPKSGGLICSNLVLALTNFWIYCELFHHSVSVGYRPSAVKPLSITTRRAWVMYCIPDGNCHSAFHDQFEQLDLWTILPGLQNEILKIIARTMIAVNKQTVMDHQLCLPHWPIGSHSAEYPLSFSK
ncbi:hypothetical protein FRB94_010764 [Tulasnella sp. JGI-2019a]|nr:hypothetical protein FRB94_010764 [Tulasnella sp. JGI-2019a]